jgi:hypothetical protein
MTTTTAATIVQGTPAAVLDQARRTIGEHEQPAGSNRTRFAKIAGHRNGYPWCATWVVAMLRMAGLELGPVGVASSRSMYRAACARGWQVPLDQLQPGDVIHMRRGLPRLWLGHVAIVERSPELVAGELVVRTIEGNTDGKGSATGGAVLRHHRPLRAWNLGAWRPPYLEHPTTPRG